MPQIANETTRSDDGSHAGRSEQLAHRVDEEADQRQRDHQRNGDREEERRMPALEHGGGDEHQPERHERQQQPVDAAETQADDLGLRRGFETQATIEQSSRPRSTRRR